MIYSAKYCFAFLMIFTLTGERKNDFKNMLDKDLSQWETYLSYKHMPGYNGKLPTDESGNPVEPVGYDKKQDVFTVAIKSGEPVLKVSGEIYGCIYTKQEYENYHFKAKVKWGNRKWTPREDKLRDTGILYHSIGECGVDYWRAWMLSQEFQIMEGHMGDYWSIANSNIDIRSYIGEGTMNPVANEKQPFLNIREQGSFCLRSENHESPAGEWTQLELICFKGKSIHIVNDHVVMVLKNSRYGATGSEKPLEKGKIQIQSEGAEAYFKDVFIKEINKLPEQYDVLFKDL